MTVLRSLALACGGYLPERVLTNDELALTVDTSDAWIRERTGIRQRHIAADGETTADLATAAAHDAIARAGLRPAEIDLLVLATSTPDHTFPATAAAVQARLGLGRIPAFDLQAVCSGFVYALATADNFLRLGQARTALVIGAETYSRILDWNDRGTCVLFGDGAGAMLLRAEEARGTPFDRGVLATRLGADGSHYRDLWVDGGPSSTGTAGHVRMNGREVFRHAVHLLGDGAIAVLDACGYAPADVDWLVPHQANKRIIDAVGRRLEIPAERLLVTVDRHANTSSASIPLALAAAERDNHLKRDQLLVLTAMGGGFTWGAALLRW